MPGVGGLRPLSLTGLQTLHAPGKLREPEAHSRWTSLCESGEGARFCF